MGLAVQVWATEAVVRFGFEDVGRPFSFRDEKGQPNGYAVELARAVAADRGLKIEVVMKSWPEILADFKAGQLDVLGHVGYLPERREFIDYTVSTMEIPGRVYVRKGTPPVASLEEFRGRKVCALAESVGFLYLQKGPWGLDVVPVHSRREGAEAVRSGRCDAMLIMELTMDHYLRTTEFGRFLEASAIKVEGSPYRMHMGVQRGRDELRATLDEGLLQLARSGQDDEIYERWVGPMRDQRHASWRHFRLVLVAMGGLSIVVIALLTLLAWQRRTLRRSREQAAALSRSESQLSAITNQISALISYIDRERRYVWVNQAYETWHARPAAEIRGGSVETLVGPEIWRDMRGSLDRAFAGEVVVCDGEVVHRDGRRRWLKVTYSPVRGPDGTVEGVILTGIDLSEMRAAQAALALRGAALEAASNAIVIVDHAGRCEWVNPAFQRLTGFPEQEIIGAEFRTLFGAIEVDGLAFDEMWGTVNEGRPWRGEFRNRRRNGVPFVQQMTITPLLAVRGAIPHFIAICDDITERRNLERQYLHAQRQESLGRLASGIAHDLNNILTPVTVIPSLLRDRVHEPELVRSLEIVETSARRGSDLLKQLLTFGRGSSARREPVALASIVDGMAAIVRETFPRNIVAEISCPDGLPLVNVDATQIHQVLLNLCVNARDAMAHGGQLHVAVFRERMSEEQALRVPGAHAGAFQVLMVRDSGVGIPAENHERVFEPFFTTKRVGEGTGLGLSTVVGIARSHGGFVRLESEVGAGTTFWVYLPETSDSIAPDAAETAAAPSDGAGRTLLVVDDEAIVAETLRTLLERRGYRVRVAGDGVEAMQILHESLSAIDAVITDLLMPRMDGITLVETIRLIDLQKPILAMSGHLTSEDARRRLEGKIAGLVEKPFTATQILGAIDRLFATERR